MPNNLNKTITIELIYALAERQEILTLKISDQSNIGQVIRQSNILNRHPEIDLTVNKVGIFSQVCKLTDTLKEGDRIEIYRPLIIEPKEARKARALKQK